MADEFPHVLFVQGEWDSSTPKLKNKLTIYFQSKKSNGGDCCVKLLGGQRATVAFKSEEVRQNVLKRNPHKIQLGKNVISLNVHLSPEEGSAAQESQSPIPEQQPAVSRQENQPTSDEEPPVAEPQSEESEEQEPPEESEGRRSAVLENIQNLNQEFLVMLVENVLRDAPESKEFCIEVIPESNCAVVTFTSRKCAENFIRFCPSHLIFKKNSLAVRPLEMTTKVKAEDLPLNLNSDYIFLYFEKFGEIKGYIKMLKDGPSAIITFQDHTAVNNVLGKQHQIKQQPLKVFPYYDSLETALYGKDRPMLRLPESFTENIDISIGNYLQENQEKMDLIKQEMCKHYCQLDLQASSVKISPLASLLQQGSQTRKLIQAWREKASAVFAAEMSKFKSLEINILRDAWSEAVAEIQKTLCAEPVTLVLQENQATVILAGLAEDVSRTRDAVNSATDSITQRIQREKGSITDEVSMAYSIYEVVRLGGVELEIQSKFPEMQLNYHSHSQKLVLYGLKQEVLESKNKILQEIIGLSRRVVELHPSILEFLTKRDKEDLTNDLFLSKGIIASLEIKNNVASLIAKTEKTLKDGEEHLKAVLIYKCLDVEDPSVIRRAEWQDLITSLNSSINSPVNVVLINTSGSQVTVSGFADALDLVLEQLNDFLEANSSITTSLEAEGIVIRFIEEHRKQDWFEMVKNKVNVDFKDDKISLSGPRVHISQCKPVFEDLLSTVYQGNLKVAKPGARKFFKKKETMYISEAKNNTGCLVELVEQQDSKALAQSVPCGAKDKGDQQQKVKDFVIDGKVLNPACFSICGPSRAAVDQAKQWIEKLISDEQAFESISDPMILNLSDKDQQRIQELQKSMDVSVRVEHKTQGAGSDDTTILVEGLSRDVLMAVSEIQTMLRKARDDFSLKKDMEVASEMVEWQYEQGGQYHSFDQLTNFKLEQALTLKSPHVDITVQGQAYKVTMPEGPAVSAVGGNQMNIKRIDKLQGSACYGQEETNKTMPNTKADPVVSAANEEFQHGGGRNVAVQSLSSHKQRCPSLELGNVTLFLKYGEIQEEATDVIVNSIGSDLDLSLGFVSRAILQKAGRGIQGEVIRNKPRNVANGTVIETKGQHLKSQAVFHTIFDLQHSKTQGIYRVTTQCLKMAEGHGFSSISFPAIGTGKLGLGKEEVSQIMIQAVVKFAKQYIGKKMEVNFVIYPTDTEKFEAFQKEMTLQDFLQG